MNLQAQENVEKAADNQSAEILAGKLSICELSGDQIQQGVTVLSALRDNDKELRKAFEKLFLSQIATPLREQLKAQDKIAQLSFQSNAYRAALAFLLAQDSQLDSSDPDALTQRFQSIISNWQALITTENQKASPLTGDKVNSAIWQQLMSIQQTVDTTAPDQTPPPGETVREVPVETPVPTAELRSEIEQTLSETKSAETEQVTTELLTPA